MTTTTEQLTKRRRAHHVALEELALRVECRVDGLWLWRKLRRLEQSLYAVCLNYTNGEHGVTLADWERAKDATRAELTRLFGGRVPAGVFVNGDPRGHMLKLDCDEAEVPHGMERDWGGNGLLAALVTREEAP